MSSPRALRWLHRIGYVTTFIVAAELAIIGYFSLHRWIVNREMAEARMAQTSTREGPITSLPTGPVEEDAVRLLATLPPLRSLSDNSLRFVAMPSFGEQWFAIALSAGPERATGILVIVPNRDLQSNAANLGPKSFVIPRGAFDTMIKRLDRRVEGWKGEPGFWTDGTVVAFERKKAGRITSGLGNSPNHYDPLVGIVHDGLAPYLPEAAQIGAG